MGKCLVCEKEIEDKYKFCFDCSKNVANQDGDVTTYNPKKKDGVIDQLQKNNNNLYKLTRQLDVLLREKYGVRVVWDKERHDFVEKVRVEKITTRGK